jgi:hypothetical protein
LGITQKENIMNFCAIGSERISFLGFERCVSAAEAIRYGIIVGLTLLIMLALFWVYHMLRVWWLEHRIHNLRDANIGLMHEIHTPNKY